MSAIFRREFRSYFTSYVGLFLLAITIFVAGFAFTSYNLNGTSTSLAGVFSILMIISIWAVIPVLTMRSFSEEKRHKTDQAFFTAPVSLAGVVIGKYLAIMIMFTLTISITLVFALVIAFIVTPDWMVIIGNFVGLTLLGGLMASAGMLISSSTESPAIAYNVTFTISFVWTLLDQLAMSFFNNAFVDSIVSFLSINGKYDNLVNGIINYNDIFFFVSLQLLFLFLTVRVLDRKRWG